MARARSLIANVGLRHGDLLDVIDVPAACGELTRHLFVEPWLEADRDLDGFWDACGETLKPDAFQQRLVEAYFLRLSAFRTVPSGFALTKPRLLDFLWRCWTIAGAQKASTEELKLDADVVGYEVSRHLVSPHLDQLDADAAQRTAVLLATKSEEPEALRRQCLRLAEKVPAVSLDRLHRRSRPSWSSTS
jgi:hypothetical protein